MHCWKKRVPGWQSVNTITKTCTQKAIKGNKQVHVKDNWLPNWCHYWHIRKHIGVNKRGSDCDTGAEAGLIWLVLDHRDNIQLRPARCRAHESSTQYLWAEVGGGQEEAAWNFIVLWPGPEQPIPSVILCPWVAELRMYCLNTLLPKAFSFIFMLYIIWGSVCKEWII